MPVVKAAGQKILRPTARMGLAVFPRSCNVIMLC
jgi:hypothetical protein